MNSKVSSKLSKMTPKFGLILGGIVSVILLILNLAGYLKIDLETGLAPVIVIAFLAYGEKLLSIPIVLLSKYFPKIEQIFVDYSENQK